jgi:Rrf2 family protein
MQFGTSIEYAIHGLIYMAGNGPPLGEGAVPTTLLVGDIAKATKVPESYLRKVMQLLARAGLVISHRGVKGGFSLALDAREITLADVVEAVDGSLPTWCCVKEQKRCGDNPCPVSVAFEEARQKMAESLAGTTIAHLASQIAQRADGWLAVTNCSSVRPTVPESQGER